MQKRAPYRHLPVIILLLGILAAITGVVTLYRVQTHVVRAAGEGMSLAATQLALKVELQLAACTGSMRLMVEDPALTAVDRASAARRLEAVKRAFPSYKSIAVTDAAGWVVAATEASELGGDWRRRPWFENAEVDARVVVWEAGDCFGGPGAGSISIVGPYRTNAGKFGGAVIACVDVQAMLEGSLRAYMTYSDTAGVPTRIQYQVLDADGDIIADSFGTPTHRINLRRLNSMAATRASLEAGPGYVEEPHPVTGETEITGYAPAHLPEGSGNARWTILVSMVRQNIVAPIRGVVWFLLGVWVVIFLPMFAFLLWTTGRLRAEWFQSQEDGARAAAAEEHYRSTMMALPVSVVRLGADHRIRYANRAFCKLVGNNQDSTLGQPFSGLLPIPGIDEYLRSAGELPGGPTTPPPPSPGFLAIREVEWRRPAEAAGAQDIRVLRLTARRVTGSAHELAVIIEDATERKRAETELRESEERYRTLVELSPDAIVVHAEGKVVFVNSACMKMFGVRSPDEAVGKPVIGFVHPDYRELVLGRMRQMIVERKKVPVAEEKFLRLDGTPFDVEVAAEPLTLHGRPAVQLVIRDVTSRKQLEEQLRQSQKMEAVGRLAGGVAHDFNNLLTAITGYSDLLLMRVSHNDPGRRYAEEIKRAGERASSLTRQLLAYSRKQVLQMRDIDLNSVVADMDKMLRRLIGEDIELETILEPALGLAKADPGQIEQVILNLAINARDAMPDGGTLRIETANARLDEAYARDHPGVQAGPHVMLSIADTGCGMDPEVQAHLFEPFFTTKEPGKGTGLGLCTVYGIIKQSGGTIQVMSTPAQGSTFKIYLPRLAAVGDGAAAAGPSSGAAGGTETILLVEDETAVRSMTSEVLEMNGYRVLEAAAGAEALAICEKHPGPIHLVIADVVLPQVGGPELARRLRSLRPEMGVLYVSGYAEDMGVAQAAVESNSAFLQKPFTPAVLAVKVREILDGAPARKPQ
ncbi:MAG: PAS domain S-box protein [Acidobacteriota bacterium]